MVDLRLIVGEHDLHLGNITCGGHRRHKYKPTDTIKKLTVSQLLHIYYLLLLFLLALQPIVGLYFAAL